MTTYNAIRETPTSNMVVKELNACVLPMTFNNLSDGELHTAYVYNGRIGNNFIVGDKRNQPTNTEYFDTILIRQI
ncbi:MAG: hypothetical protein KBA02_06590 [Paludibacteraceae bacterium]|nr:hypothetical protein [Paludibacteraceae bacterium]